jgi:hypothetical protein
VDDLSALAAVLAPPEGAVEVTRATRWAGLAAGSAAAGAVVLRGRPALARGASPVRLAGWAAGREVALAAVRVRPRAPYGAATVHRSRPAPLRPGLLPRARAVLAGGAVVRLGPGDGRTRLDEVLTAAGVAAGPPPRAGSGGTVLVLGRTAPGAEAGSGRPVVLRVRPGPVAPPGQAVAPDGVPCVPRVLATGTTCGLAWVLEERLPGRVPAHLRGPLLRDVVAFSARLAGRGRRDGGSDVRPGVLEDVETVAAARPDLADPLAVLADRVAERLGELPAVPVHGDLWRGNLLAAGGRLTGVVDWDAARAAGPAGTDLLHLVATQERLTARRGIGAQVRRRPWSGAAFTALAADYWRSLGVQPSPAALEALGLAWWLGQVAATLRRTPELAADPAWSRRELAEVVAALVPAREGAR